MGNEGSRSSRHASTSSPLRRSSSRRLSKSNNSSSGNGGGAQQYIAEDEMDRNNQEMLAQTPKPVIKRMDKIRRSLSFRRKKKQPAADEDSAKGHRVKLQTQLSTENQSSSLTANLTSSVSAPLAMSTALSSGQNASTPPGSVKTDSQAKPVAVKPAHWVEDEKKVRAGNCSFQVKYLGSLEVSDSRGMHLCELAIEKLLAVSVRLSIFLTALNKIKECLMLQ